ncbi:MAG TPA: flagellar basal body rod C-terminal domain-containing protein, partial [Devosia sp.]|nr:flagellar basal body rod C-terminal domain-containing protein [Devosia sp.]
FDSTAYGLPLNVNAAVNGGVLAVTTTNAGTVIIGLTKRITATAVQGDGPALSLFVDQGNAAFTNNLNGYPPQKQGFASRISINSQVLADNSLLVQAKVGGTLGDAERPNYLIEQLNSMQFVSGGNPALNKGRFQLSGNLGEVINQTINFQGSTVNAALTKSADRQLTLDTVVQQMDSEYGVDVNEEMARLTELQNSYAANAHVVSVVKQLLETLFQSV